MSNQEIAEQILVEISEIGSLSEPKSILSIIITSAVRKRMSMGVVSPCHNMGTAVHYAI